MNLEPMSLERFGVPSQVFDVFIENQYVADAAEVLDLVYVLLCPLSHL
jgi:hypothetical protein